MIKILVAEDEPNLRAMIAKSLIKEGYKVTECYDGKNALDTFYNEHFDLVVTDIMMPRMDGNQFAKQARAGNPDIPILMLTALESIDDKEKGFSSGTDDYLVKPILMKELVMRVKALLRRYKINSEKRIELENSVVDFSMGELSIKGAKINLSKKEFQLLSKLLSSPNIIFSREQLLDEIWGYESESTDRTVDTHISSLKKKAACGDFEILTVWGIGYKAVIKCYQQ
ncbi:MAG: response regulator transcription factor [Firmicutes bacterium]|nr:response regulator transcription factor [Bacillota bacterium]